MNWINDPLDNEDMLIQPMDACNLHVCWARDEGTGPCTIRICLTEFCWQDF